ncbi:MAG: enoyl-CoA hydratase/isomerase family protein [Gammaproteobacteria bacterium]|nr:enoyl-CoA hydratase/isomerase family protein [Gammaproteobacteria bacterium]
MRQELQCGLTTASSRPVWEQTFKTLELDLDRESRSLTYRIKPDPRPSFTPSVLAELRYLQRTLRDQLRMLDSEGFDSPVRFLLAGSAADEGLLLGGDLQFFLDAIQAGDRNALYDYARLGIDVLYDNIRNLDNQVTTIAVLTGPTLGAGFESALSCDFIIAEPSVQMGFPEVLFNMFPGMGAYSLLARRLAPGQVERMISSGKLYSAAELHEMGIIDVLAKPGEGWLKAREFVQRFERRKITLQAVLRMRNRVNPIQYDELRDVMELWVDSAMQLSERDLKAMTWLLRGQNKRVLEGRPSAAAAPARAAREVA